MAPKNYARSFRDLNVYKESQDVTREILRVSKSFPKEEAYALTDQIRRSSRSVGAQIAEAWAKRRYPKHFTSKLSDADGEQLETQHWLEVASDCEYITEAPLKDLLQRLSRIGKMLNAMMSKAASFCQDDDRLVREEQLDYIVSSEMLQDVTTFG